jgi:CubicO group peptidase (beta-lactamase class C family)
MYNCKPGCVALKNEVVVSNQTGDIIYTHIGATLYENIMFPVKGIYTITLTAYCGDKKCECKFQITVDKGTVLVEPPLGGNPGSENPNGNPPTTNTTTPTSSAIEKALQDILPPDFSGGILVAKKDSILYEKYKGNNVGNHTSFDLASVAKTFTAMAVLKTAEEKKIGLSDDITKYLPNFPMAGITIKMLLSHTSGLEDYVKFMQTTDVDKSNMLSNADLLQYIIKNKEKVKSGLPGAAFNYSNTNFALLALIIEKVSGQTYGQHLAEKFFTPLKMEDTYVFSQATAKTATPSYYKNGKAYDLKFLDFIYGDKNIYTSVKDMMKWDRALRDGKIFSKETMALAYTPNTPLIADQSNYGLGWRLLLVPNGKKIVYHNGWWHGNRSVFIRLLDEDAVIVILSNSSFTTISNSRKLADLFGAYKQTGRSMVNF